MAAPTTYVNVEGASTLLSCLKHLQFIHSLSLRRYAFCSQWCRGAPSSLIPRLPSTGRCAAPMVSSARGRSRRRGIFLSPWFALDQMRSRSTVLERAHTFASKTGRATTLRSSLRTMRFSGTYHWQRFFTSTSSGRSTKSRAAICCSWTHVPICDFAVRGRGSREEGDSNNVLVVGAVTTPWRKNAHSVFVERGYRINHDSDYLRRDDENSRVQLSTATEVLGTHIRAGQPFRIASKKLQRLRCSNSLDTVSSCTFLPYSFLTHPSALTMRETNCPGASTASTTASGVREMETKLRSAFLEAPCHISREIIWTTLVESKCTHCCDANLFVRHDSRALELSRGDELVPSDGMHGCMLCNKVRNDKKDRKRAFPQRGFWKKQHFLQYKNENTRLAFAVQGIDLLKLKSLTWGEVRKRRRS